MNDETLLHFAEDIDNRLSEWGMTYRIPPTQLFAVILGRLVVMAQQTGCQEEIFILTDRVRQSIMEAERDSTLH